MSEPVLWDLEDHTQAKHRVLRAYLDGWIPVMGQQALRVPSLGKRRLLLVDGFAGPGRYNGGAAGSPLIMLDALSSHSALPRLSRVEFLYRFIEQDKRRVDYLANEVSQLTLPPNVDVHIEHGRFEDVFGEVVDGAKERGKVLVPTFAFIDPFGYSTASMSVTGRLLDFPRSEALFFLPLSYICRFVSRDGQEASLNNLFGTDEWENAIPLSGEERERFLIGLFERQLLCQGQVKHVRSFELHTRTGNDYRLVFATGHDRGLEIMKEAMWRVDPLEGTRYVARTETGQAVLFEEEVNTQPLLAELRSNLGGRWFTVDEAANVTLFKTPFVPSKHLKTKSLVPAEKNGVIEVERPEGCRAGSFTEAVKIRFK